MCRYKKLLSRIIPVFTITFLIMAIAVPSALIAVIVPSASAQYWTAMPPYNVLWPLWSPSLSPVDPLTSLATPLIPELSNDIILPVQPILVWDPAQVWAYAVYNIPPQLGGGLTYFSPYYGLNPWPPSYLTDPTTGSPAPLALPIDYQLLPPLDPEIQLPVFGGPSNYAYLFQYSTPVFGIPFLSLLTIADIWGLPPL